MAELLVKTYTRHRNPSDPLYLRDWTAGDIVHIFPDGTLIDEKGAPTYPAMMKMNTVIRVDSDLPLKYHQPIVSKYTGSGDDHSYKLLGRSGYIIKLEDIFTDNELKDLFNHDLVCQAKTVGTSYLDLLRPRSERTGLLTQYDKSGSVASGDVYVRTSGGNYVTMVAAESDLAATLTGAVRIIADDDSAIQETSTLAIAGVSTSAANTLTFMTANEARHGGQWTASGHRFSVNGMDVIIVEDNYVILDGLQLDQAYSSDSTPHAVLVDSVASSNLIIVDSCIIKNSTSSNYVYGIRGQDADLVIVARNNIFYDFTPAQGRTVYAYDCSDFYAICNTIYNCTYALRQRSGTFYAYNNILVGNSDDFNGTITADYNMSDDQDGGSHDLAPASNNWANEMPNYASYDFSIINTGNAYLGSELTQADNSYIPTNDIIGTARNTGAGEQTSVGAFEYATGGEPTTYTETTDIDALIQRAGIINTASLDSILLKSFTVDVSIDSLLQIIRSQSVNLDSFIKEVGIINSTNLDVLLKQLGLSESLNIDSLLLKTVTSTINIDSLLQNVNVISTTDLDALLQQLGLIKSVNIDAWLQQQNLIKTTDLDALLKQLGVSESVDIDSLIKKEGNIFNVDLDSLLQSVNLINNVDLDALIKRLNLAESVDIDTLLQGQDFVSIIQLDSLLKELNLTESISIDALIKELNIIKNVSIDAILKVGGFPSLSLDALIKLLGVTVSTQLDSLLQRSGIIESLSIDSILKRVGISTTTSLDSILHGFGIRISTSLDAYLLGEGTGQQIVSLDALLKGLGIQFSVNLDALLLSQGFATLSIDSLLAEEVAVINYIDALLQKSLMKNVSLDSLIKQTGQTDFIYIDSLISKSRIKQLDIDSILKGIILKDILFDSLLQKTSTSSVYLDSVITRLRTIALSIDGILTSSQTVSINIDSLLKSIATKLVYIDAILLSGSRYPRYIFTGNVRNSTFTGVSRTTIFTGNKRDTEL